MDKRPLHTTYLLNDLQSIRDLLDDPEQLLPPLLVDHSQEEDVEIPLLSEVIEPADEQPIAPPPAPPTGSQRPLRLDRTLRQEAELLLQEVVDDFVPQIEAELRRRLEARLDRLLSGRLND